jgi:hypothetical protein
MEINIGTTRINPSGCFADHFSHNVGNNHETYIEYMDNREISLPLASNGTQINTNSSIKLPIQAIYGNWNGKSIFERKECKERQRQQKRDNQPIGLNQNEKEILRNREYYYGKKRY